MNNNKTKNKDTMLSLKWLYILLVLIMSICILMPKKVIAGEMDATGDLAPLYEELAPFNHPWQKLKPVKGKIPGINLKDSPDGYRYGIMYEMSMDENGKLKKTSGVEKFERRIISDEEIEKINIRKPYREKKENIVEKAPKIGKGLAKSIELSPASEPLDVILFLERLEGRDIVDRLDENLALGEIKTLTDYREKRKELIKKRQIKIRKAQNPVIKAIKKAGGHSIPLRKYALPDSHSRPIADVAYI